MSNKSPVAPAARAPEPDKAVVREPNPPVENVTQPAEVVDAPVTEPVTEPGSELVIEDFVMPGTPGASFTDAKQVWVETTGNFQILDPYTQCLAAHDKPSLIILSDFIQSKIDDEQLVVVKAP